jgi:Serine/threonine protein kinase
MEYVRGETLRAVMQRRRLSLAEVAGVVSQIGRALSAAHREGVYHRDLKPENVRGSSRVDLQACKLGTGRRFTTS